MLVQQGVITQAHLNKALKAQRGQRKRLGEVLVELGFASESDIAACVAAQFGYEVLDVKNLVPEADALGVLTPTFALSRRVLPIRNTGDAFECVIADPVDVLATDLIPRPRGKRLIIYVAPAGDLTFAIRRAYALPEDASQQHRKEIKIPSRRREPKPHRDRDALLEMIDLSTTKRASGTRHTMFHRVTPGSWLKGKAGKLQ